MGRFDEDFEIEEFEDNYMDAEYQAEMARDIRRDLLMEDLFEDTECMAVIRGEL